MTPDGTIRANKPSKVKMKASASLRKRKLEAESDQEELPRSKKGKVCSPQSENASYKPINVILTDKYAAKNQPKTLEYEWSNVRKLWIVEEAPQEMREWTRKGLCMLSEYLNVNVASRRYAVARGRVHADLTRRDHIERPFVSSRNRLGR
jgi:hypothetical protein